MYFYDFSSFVGRFKDKTGKVLLFTRSKFSPLLLFSFRARVKSASRDLTCQTGIHQPIKSLTLAIRLLLLQATTGNCHGYRTKTLEKWRDVLLDRSLFSLNFHSCYVRRSQLFSTRLVYEKQAGKTRANRRNPEVSCFVFTSRTKYSCCREVTAVPHAPCSFTNQRAFLQRNHDVIITQRNRTIPVSRPRM